MAAPPVRYLHQGVGVLTWDDARRTLMLLPKPRGPLSDAVCRWLTSSAAVDERAMGQVVDSALRDCDVVRDDDIQVTLWQLYELHYQGFDGVDPDWEWRPEALHVRRRIEVAFESALRAATRDTVRGVVVRSGALADRLFDLVRGTESPPLASYLQRRADPQQLVEFLVHRSIYQLKEADPHTWAIPRLRGKAKVTLAEIQYDEYGSGRPAQLHAQMFADTLHSCGLDSGYGAYVDAVPGLTLATSNAMSMFGLQRRLRGATVGHLAAFEASSSLPNRRYAAAVRRLGFADHAARYFDEHVEADAVHEQLAMRQVCGTLAAENPDLEPDIAFGAAVCLHLDGLVAGALMDAWSSQRSSLREPVGDVAGAPV